MTTAGRTKAKPRKRTTPPDRYEREAIRAVIAWAMERHHWNEADFGSDHEERDLWNAARNLAAYHRLAQKVGL